MRCGAIAKFSAAACACVLLAACGSATSSSSTPPPAVSSTSATAAGATSTASTATTTTTITTTASATSTQPATPLCVASALSLSFLGQLGATGHGELGFALHNTSGHACHTFGYPGILFLDKSGHPLPTKPTRTTRDFFGPAQLAELVVEPGATVSFRLGVTHGTQPGVACATAYALQVIAPDDTATIRAPIADGAFECQTATVTPLQPGTSAFSGP
jgi:Domain of unknown function (DUF4232)